MEKIGKAKEQIREQEQILSRLHKTINVRGSALGTAYILAHSVLLQKLPWSRVVQHTPSHWQNLKLETGIIEFQVAPFVTVEADIRGARYLLRVWWA